MHQLDPKCYEKLNLDVEDEYNYFASKPES